MSKIAKLLAAGATIVPNAVATIPQLTRKGFHAYFGRILSGYSEGNALFTDWRGLRLPCVLKPGARGVRMAFPVSQH